MPPDRPGRPYDHLKTLAQRVVRLDPSFSRAYLYGAGILGWFHGVERLDEAVELLEEGMRRDPGEPLYSLFLPALAFKEKGHADKMIALLEAAPAPSALSEEGRAEYARAIAEKTEIWRGSARDGYRDEIARALTAGTAPGGEAPAWLAELRSRLAAIEPSAADEPSLSRRP